MSGADSHPCFMPRCERMASADWALCGTCWRTLPKTLRDQIARAYVRGMTVETMTPGMFKVIGHARAWIFQAFGDIRPEKYDPGRWDRLKRYVREKDEARAAARAAGRPIPRRPRCPSSACPCAECVAEYGAIIGTLTLRPVP